MKNIIVFFKTHFSEARVRRVTHHPLQPSWIVASFQGNNEISMWDLETAAKKHTLWASQHPPLTYSQVGVIYVS